MRYYELTCLIPKELSEEEKNSLPERIISCLPCQPVKKQRDSFFITLEFHSEPEKIAELENKLKSVSPGGSLRYMLLTKKFSKKQPKKPSTKTKPEKLTKLKGIFTPGPPAKDVRTSPEREKKVELKEIEKKLDEILNE